MKSLSSKILYALFLLLTLHQVLPPLSVYALFGGGISGPLQVYDPKVIAQTLEIMQHNAAMLQLEQQNLARMDSATAAANMYQIQANLQQLANLQNELSGMIMDYSDFQGAWGAQYHDFADYNGMTAEDYAYNARNLLYGLNRSSYDAMRAQGLIANYQDTSDTIEQLIQASQSAQGAKAAAQVGNLIAAQQVQQMMQFQQMVAQSNRQQSEWIAYQTHKAEMSRQADEEFFTEPTTPTKGNGPGFYKW